MTTESAVEEAHRVVVTGLGVVSPIGIGRAQFWDELCAGRSGIAPAADAARIPTIAAAARDFDAKAFIDSPHLRRMDHFSRMIVAASRMALDDAGMPLAEAASDRVGIVVGTALGDLSESATYIEKVFTKGPAAASPMLFPNLVLNSAAAYASMIFGCTGINLTVAQAETSGEHAIRLGCEMVRAGRADVVLAGGGDELAPILTEVHRQARALSGQRGGDEWCSPYDRRRNGLVLGEGAAMLVLESAVHATMRGVHSYAEIAADAGCSVPAPLYDWPDTAIAALRPLQRLLGDRAPDLICGAANSSRVLDAVEMDLFGRVCGERSETLVTSIKGAIGEFGGAGALTVAAACLALREQAVPPLCHRREPEHVTAFRFAPTQAVAHPLDRVLVFGLGHGGSGIALLLRRTTPR
ncbi:MAG TPA: beta-ketoacyl synthase N-terminal-like domain-containing protein [Candidatus Binatia bacterium]|nr:beta-ketoacyl synthase N-terminal-like domain-containing protein [Candidatus Binatia bacterium]